MEKVIKTKRLVLRPMNDDDLPYIVSGLNNLEVSRWLAVVPHPYTDEDAINFRQRNMKTPASYRYWVITLNDKCIGGISIHPKLGYWLAQEYWGQGIMSEAVHAVVSEYFNTPDRPPLLSGHFSGNKGSQRILTKMGFSEIMRGHELNLATGKTFDHVDVGLTREQWFFLNPLRISAGEFTLCSVTQEDVDVYYDITSRYEVSKNLGSFEHPLTRDTVVARVEAGRYVGSWNAWLKIMNAKNEMVGSIGFHSPSKGARDDLGIGYMMHPDYWGQGIMTQAVRGLCRFLFDHYNVDNIHAEYFDDNPSSGRVLQKVGFEVVGHSQGYSKARGGKAPVTQMRLSKSHFAKSQECVNILV